MVWYGALPTPWAAIGTTRWWHLDRAPAEHRLRQFRALFEIETSELQRRLAVLYRPEHPAPSMKLLHLLFALLVASTLDLRGTSSAASVVDMQPMSHEGSHDQVATPSAATATPPADAEAPGAESDNVLAASFKICCRFEHFGHHYACMSTPQCSSVGGRKTSESSCGRC
jgi:hypothetical protein